MAYVPVLDITASKAGDQRPVIWQPVCVCIGELRSLEVYLGLNHAWTVLTVHSLSIDRKIYSDNCLSAQPLYTEIHSNVINLLVSVSTSFTRQIEIKTLLYETTCIPAIGHPPRTQDCIIW